ncbi:AsmA family protein [Candidimonas sp. SYP-B2681]|uniref:AsmA family protein n=1 Tax=Candidimonas sp. SYP-B2681 TaxID=2497686 RepID=UPI000F879C74|nr:AsmA family protein [Candidimonas sp. SYP-B2681]RTZ39985.1 AsmA family protein [Candidimonas sp. SYP-B2681]
MKVWFKRILISIVVVFLVALVGIAIFLLTFDPNAYKSKLEEIVFDRYQRTLSIKGDIELSLFPRIGLSVQGVSLSDRDSSDTFASIDSARFAVAIWPLMSNRLVVDHVAVTGFKAWLIRDEQGDFNFRDLIERRSPVAALLAPAAAVAAAVLPEASAASATVAPSTASASGSVPVAAARQMPAALSGHAASGTDFQIDIAGLDLKNGEIHLFDKVTGSVARVVQLDVNTGRMTYDQAFDVALKGKLIGDFPVADARLEGQAVVKFNPEQQTYSAQKINVLVNGKLGQLEAKSATLRGNLAYSAYSQMFSASNVEFLVQGELVGDKPVKNLETSLIVPQLKIDRSQAELQVEKMTYRAKGNRPDDNFDIAFDAPRLSVSPGSAKGEPISGTVKLRSKDKVLGVALGLNGIGGNAQKLTLKELKVDGGLKQGDRLVQLKMTSPANWDMLQKKGALSAMKGDVRIEDAALPGGTVEVPFIGSLQTDLIKDELVSEINAVLSSSKLNFRVKATQLANPKVAFDLSADRLDLNTMFPPPVVKAVPTETPVKEGTKPAAEPAQKAAAATTARTPIIVPASTLDLSFLNSVDIIGNIAIGEIKVKDLEAGQFAAALRAADGELTISGITANLYDGKLDGKITATSNNEVGADLSLQNIALGPFLQGLAQENRLTGQGSVNVLVNSQGLTVPALKSGLTGTVQARVRDGAVKGLNVSQTLREATAVVRNMFSGQLPDVATEFDLGRQTDFTTLDADIDFNHGQGTVKRLSLVGPLLRISQGTPASLDIVNNQLDLSINVRVVNTSTEQDGKELAELKNATVPVRISGPFDKLTYQVQWKDIGSKAVKAAVRDGLIDMLSNKAGIKLEEPPPASPIPPPPKKPMDPVKSIGDALKGLLGQ